MAVTSSFAVWDLLEKLGSPEFGLITQAVLAACFRSLGASMEEMKQAGHPDMEFDFQNRHWRVEVEFAHPSKGDYEVKEEDVQATRPLSEIDVGYLAILDCSYPVNWRLIDTRKMLLEGLGVYSLSKLRSLSEVELSKTCTEWSIKFFAEHEEEIVVKRYPGICEQYVFQI